MPHHKIEQRSDTILLKLKFRSKQVAIAACHPEYNYSMNGVSKVIALVISLVTGGFYNTDICSKYQRYFLSYMSKPPTDAECLVEQALACQLVTWSVPIKRKTISFWNRAKYISCLVEYVCLKCINWWKDPINSFVAYLRFNSAP